jgi:putative membrane protein
VLRDNAARSQRWSKWRTASFLSGCVVLAASMIPAALPFTAGDFRQHMVQHILMGMLAPLGLVMGAPVTLLLRTLPAHQGRMAATVLRSTPVRVLTHPLTALALNLGGMAALYFTPLYAEMMINPALHYLVSWHFVAAGCLYAWVIAGPDPAPHRISVPARLVVLGLAVIIHSVMAQLLYAGVGVAIPAPTQHLQQAAELMYYLGDMTEILLAFALVSTWRPAPRAASKAALLAGIPQRKLSA